MLRSRLAAGWAALGLCLAFFSASLSAATITVDDGTDPLLVKGPTCSLRSAVDAANFDEPVAGCPTGSGADIIEFVPGLAGATIDLLFIGSDAAGDSALRISSDITILGDPVDGITLDIGEVPSDKGLVQVEMRHFYIGTRLDDCPDGKGACKGDPGTPALTLENVNVTGGFARGGDGGEGSGGGGGAAGMGGAIFNDGHTLTLIRSALFKNAAIGGDGGEGASVIKTVFGGFGGGGGGGLAGDGEALFNGDGAFGGPPNAGVPSGGAGGFGGGGAGGDGWEPACVKGDIDDAEGANGGAGGFGGGGGGGGEGTQFGGCLKSHLGGDGGNGGFGGGGGGRGGQDVTMNKGSAPPGGGGFGGGPGFETYGGGGAGMGGAVFSYFGTVNVINSTISTNAAVAGDLGCLVEAKGFCPIFGTKGIADPARGLGGGIFIYDGTLNMNNATLSGNVAENGIDPFEPEKGGSSGDGGAVYIFDTTIIPVGSKSGATVSINNSILANSDADDDFDTNADGCPACAKGDIGSGDNNIIEDNEGFDGGAMQVEPFLFSLDDNDGPTLTHLPEGTPDNGAKGDQSPAIGGGNNATCETEDQRAFFRPAGPDCDIGSVEVGATADDGDGVDAEIEDGAPNGGDGNDDGTIDSIQSDVASFPSATGNGYITLEIIEDCGQLLNVTAVDPASLPPNAPSGEPVEYPFGLVQFELPCESAIVDVLFQNATDLTGTSYDKYGPTVPGDAGTTDWYSFSDAGFAILTAPNVWTLDLLDGRLGDDTDGSDDIIFDQGGPGRLARVIPTTDWRGLVLLAVLLAVTGVLVRRRRLEV